MDYLQMIQLLEQCPQTEARKSQLIHSIRSTLAKYSLCTSSIANIIIDYAKFGKVKVYDASNINLPSTITREFPVINERPSPPYYQCIKISEISTELMSLFTDDNQPQFGDMILFADRYVSFFDLDTSKLWLSNKDRSDWNQYVIIIPKEITYHMKDAFYFYNVPTILQNEFDDLHFAFIELSSDDLGLKDQLNLPINEQLPLDWQYKLTLNTGCNGLTVTNSNNVKKTFSVNGYNTIHHMKTYFSAASEKRIAFKIRFEQSYDRYFKHDSSDNDSETVSDEGQTVNKYEDLLPLTWDRKCELINRGFYRY
eukprot:186906_1